ncbi:hypothetical protein E8E13_003322 [Curvularia kusanoi]|uniref:Uncharacterized protein n=1 Tax=Curvularia kusanoi TaxID=90978 RepID=A0A9P4W719_CURKU|nr:hypothetical protein E8E13_003322 [Curvularia kusanoi]
MPTITQGMMARINAERARRIVDQEISTNSDSGQDDNHSVSQSVTDEDTDEVEQIDTTVANTEAEDSDTHITLGMMKHLNAERSRRLASQRNSGYSGQDYGSSGDEGVSDDEDIEAEQVGAATVGNEGEDGDTATVVRGMMKHLNSQIAKRIAAQRISENPDQEHDTPDSQGVTDEDFAEAEHIVELAWDTILKPQDEAEHTETDETVGEEHDPLPASPSSVSVTHSPAQQSLIKASRQYLTALRTKDARQRIELLKKETELVRVQTELVTMQSRVKKLLRFRAAMTEGLARVVPVSEELGIRSDVRDESGFRSTPVNEIQDDQGGAMDWSWEG